MQGFSVARLPRIEFGRGVISKLPDLVASFGSNALIVTGAKSFTGSEHWAALQTSLQRLHIRHQHCVIDQEPSPHRVDEIVASFAHEDFSVVIGIGGGSVLDAAKAIAGLLRVQHSVMEYLEGVGPERPYVGPAVPFIAVPTTAGTGSEATKNAVLSVQARDGFKKSFRHDKLVAEYALIDPALLSRCPPQQIAANGMDALTQLIESYVSLKANVFTDSLALEGIRLVRDGLLEWYREGEVATAAQDNMSYGALISGITLAQVGLGSVHGLASPMGAFYPIPHGVVCGTLLAPATRVNIEAMKQREPDNPALKKYRKLGATFFQTHIPDADKAYSGLVRKLEQWSDELCLPRLAQYGVTEQDLDHIVANSRGSSMRTNPIVLSDDEIKDILRSRL
ncbi:MAG: iron-containing alcohol dehydrogenase [Gammaproteobacteria bacterium]|nr:iron-containing alcohol dehydrogenase [Gammaproteobacteria bacterium]